MSVANEMSWREMGNWVCPVRVGDPIPITTGKRIDAGRINDDELLEMDVRQTKYLAWLVEREEELELTDTTVNAIWFRYKPHRLFELNHVEIDNLNAEVLRCLRTADIAARSMVDSEDRFVLSAVGTSRGTKTSDLESLVREVLYWGRCLLGRRGGVSFA